MGLASAFQLKCSLYIYVRTANFVVIKAYLKKLMHFHPAQCLLRLELHSVQLKHRQAAGGYAEDYWVECSFYSRKNSEKHSINEVNTHITNSRRVKIKELRVEIEESEDR